MESKTKFILIGLGVVAAGAGAYYFLKKRDENDIKDFQDMVSSGTPVLPAASTPPATTYKAPAAKKPAVVYNQFPLKKGSKGTTVRDLQNALNQKYGAKIGIDGDWGNETQTALQKLGLPLVIDSQTYAKIILGTQHASKPAGAATATTSSAVEINSPTISMFLHTAIKNDNIFQALDALKKIKNVDKYIRVNEQFKKTEFWTTTFGHPVKVAKSVVNALHDQFSSTEYKKKINGELYRIGLKYDGKQWSLSGLSAAEMSTRLVTIANTHIWDDWGHRIKVPKSTILGLWKNAGNGATQFQALDGRIFYVNTNAISYEP